MALGGGNKRFLLALYFVVEIAAVEYVNIAGLFSLTYPDGNIAQWGVDSKDAMLLAVREINAEESGKSTAFRLVLSPDDIVDSRCDPISSKPKAGLLLKRNRTLTALLGVDCSGVYKAIASEYEAVNIPVLSYGSGSPEFSSPTVYPYFLRSIPSDTLTAKALATVIAHFGWPGVGIVHTSDPFGAGAAEIVEEQARGHGFVVLRVVAFDRGDPAEVVQARMLQLRDAGITKIIISAPVPETRDVFRAATTLNMTGAGYAYLATEMVGAETIDDSQAFPAAEGYLATMLSAEAAGSSYRTFLDKFQQAYGRHPDRWAGFSYDMVFVLAEGIRNESRRREGEGLVRRRIQSSIARGGASLMQALRRVRIERGATGELSFSPNTNDRSDMPYDIFNLQGKDLIAVGTTYPSGTFDTTGRPPIVWPGTSTREVKEAERK